MNQNTQCEEIAAMPRIWPFFAAIPVSLLMAIALAPRIGGVAEYLISYGFLAICSAGYLVAGKMKKKGRYVYTAILMILFAPILPVLIAEIYDSLFQSKM